MKLNKLLRHKDLYYILGYWFHPAISTVCGAIENCASTRMWRRWCDVDCPACKIKEPMMRLSWPEAARVLDTT